MSDKPTPDWQDRWDLLQRYRFIEIIALWEGRLTTNHLCNAFGIGRQLASKLINTYNNEVGVNNLILDTKLKGYRPAESFSPVICRGVIDEYLNLLSQYQTLDSNTTIVAAQNTQIESIVPPLRQVNPDFVRPILEAARQKMRVEIQYTSLSQPEPRDRMIAPHTLVFNGYRWHVRAFCEESQSFKDFLLSRMTDISEITLKATKLESDDSAWNTFVDLVIVPDPRLSAAQRKVIENDFAMREGKLSINTRATLVSYYLQLLRIDKATPHNIPTAQQIILQNRNELTEWILPD